MRRGGARRPTIQVKGADDMKTLLLALMMPMAAVAADFDVRGFGAKGDGVAKDTDAIVRLTFDDCDFNVVSDAELPGYHRHGAADWCRRPGDTNRFAEIR